MRPKSFALAAFPTLTLLAGLGTFGCGNPADDVAPARVSPPRVETQPASSVAPKESSVPGETSTASREKPKGAESLPFSSASSKIEFTGSKVTGHHNGGFKTFEGTWDLVTQRPEEGRVQGEIAMDSIFTDTDRLTGHLKSPDFFDVAKFPKATFTTTEIKAGTSDTKAKNATHTVTGNLTLHGVTKSIQFPARIAVSPESANLESEFSINRKDFGVSYPGMANDLIRDEVVIRLAIHATRKS
jgi:polyisoprenoid-binding protein YceI